MSKKEFNLKQFVTREYKKIIAATAVLLIILVAIMVMNGPAEDKKAEEVQAIAEAAGNFKSDMIYYYGDENVYCKNIEKFMKDNKIESIITFAKKEVWHDGSNDMEMKERAKQCGLKPEKIGVPMIWSGGKCYVGQVEVQNFLKKEAGLK